MKGVSIRVEDGLHRRLRLVVLQKDVSIQDFVLRLLEQGVAQAEREVAGEGDR